MVKKIDSLAEGTLVKVYWEDICSHSNDGGYENPEYLETVGQLTVGFLITKNGRVIRIGNDQGKNDGKFREVTVIPKVNVLGVIPLKEDDKNAVWKKL